MEHLLTITTCPDLASAENLGAQLLERRLIACVNILPGAVSMYEWKGRVEKEQECVLLMKTRATVFSRLQQTVNELHPYELPELIAVPIEMGAADYLSWVDQQVDG